MYEVCFIRKDWKQLISPFFFNKKKLKNFFFFSCVNEKLISKEFYVVQEPTSCMIIHCMCLLSLLFFSFFEGWVFLKFFLDLSINNVCDFLHKQSYRYYDINSKRTNSGINIENIILCVKNECIVCFRGLFLIIILIGINLVWCLFYFLKGG